MGLSNDLISQFVKVTKDDTKTKSESTVYGTIVELDGEKYVKIDGSDLLTPISSTTNIDDGERVTVAIKNHTATVTGNISSPSARSYEVEAVGNQISEFEIVIADKVSTIELDAEKARIDELEVKSAEIDNLVADNVTIKNTLTATEAKIETLTADNVTINEKLTATEATIKQIDTEKLDAEVADITYATITDLEATNADIYNLNATYANFEVTTTNKLTAMQASIDSADIKYANIDFSNIGKAAMEYLYATSGLIENVTISDGTITGNLIGVTIKGDLIEGNTIIADKLVIKGEDGLYYKLNTNGVTSETEQTDYNSLNGSVITAKSITATKISVDDLVAFDATIGGFNITESSIYSGVKESVNNTIRGVYLDNDGQIAFGDSTNFVKFFKDTDGNYKLGISAGGGYVTVDDNGLTIQNGAITILNGNGETVLVGDENGNLALSGSIIIDSVNDQQLLITTNNSDLPILAAQNHGIFAKSIQVAGSYQSWLDNRYYGGTSIDADIIKTPAIDVDEITPGSICYHRYTKSTESSYSYYWTEIAILSVSNADEDSYISISLGSKGFKTNANERAVLTARLKQNGDMGNEDNVYFSMNLQQATPYLSASNFKAKLTNCNSSRTTVEIYMKITASYKSYYIQKMDYYGTAVVLQNQPFLSDSSLNPAGVTEYTCTEKFYNRQILSNYIRPVGTTLNILVSNETSSNTGINISSTGVVSFLKSGTTVHSFSTSGTKTGGSMEIEGIRYGMSPTDSPQTLIEYIVPDVVVSGETKIPLDEIYKQMISYYIVMSSNPDVRVKEKNVDYILLSGEGITDLLIKGQRKNADEYFRIMGGLDDYSVEKEDEDNGITEGNNN